MGRQEEEEDLATVLPDDVLADVLRRVAPRGLAACRCVCRAWRALVDDRRLLRADLLPRSLAGLFLCCSDLDQPEFLARPGVDFTSYLMPWGMVDHCSGLILQYTCVLNPATGRRTYLPEEPPPLLEEKYFLEDYYLAFDPTESPHYEVFLVPMVLDHHRAVADRPPAIAESEWPPSPFDLNVFASRTGRWEQRSLLRRGEAAGKVGDMEDDVLVPRHSACWRGALYVHLQNDFVIRISLSDNTYRVIKPPKEIQVLGGRLVHLARSQKGVYFAYIDDKSCLCVWILDDSCDEWILRHRSACGLALPTQESHPPSYYTPWIFTNLNNFGYDRTLQDDASNNRDGSGNSEALAGQELGWDSDDENIIHTEERTPERLAGLTILGFHPYKEIVFLHKSSRGLAYHLKTSKLEDLGNLYPKGFASITGPCSCVESAFPYTPCWMGDL